MNIASIYPNKKDQSLAKNMLKSIGANNSTSKKIAINILGENQSFVLPNEAAGVIVNLLKDIVNGNLYSEKLLTTQEAADILGVSRPHLVMLLEAGKMPHTKVGSHRRVSQADVLAFKNSLLSNRNKQLKFLQKQAQELNLGYE